MKYLNFILILFLISNASNLKADDKVKQLDKLFNDLKSKNPSSSYQIEQKQFLKEHGHRTVPVLYWNKTHLNKVDTQEFTHEILQAEMDLENYVGGVESFKY